MGKENKINYIKAYNKKTYRSVNVMFRMDNPEQKALWEWLHTRYSTAGALRDAAMEAMRAEKKKGEQFPSFIFLLIEFFFLELTSRNGEKDILLFPICYNSFRLVLRQYPNI